MKREGKYRMIFKFNRLFNLLASFSPPLMTIKYYFYSFEEEL